ncbi:hypothetical protein K7711_36570 [Nocardia sp. CA2R105]|uniref:hypothetical protein n=1 Tax=Nocardia coffeae TaxID=2873381 RepID=UPI001CA749D4|nr:hypothetical protein [Nocardia coffeae]MBY8862039.1 hypothetical protein [Nocardia coffeae]
MSIQRHPIIAIAAIVLVLLASIALAVSHHEHSSTAPATSEGTETTPASRPGNTAEVPGVDLNGNLLELTGSDTGQALPQNPAARPDPRSPGYLSAPPAGLEWQRGWRGAALPVSRSDGPERIRDGVASGFAHTPQGAGLAACDAIARAVAAPEGIWQNVIRERYLGGGQALIDRFARNRAQTPDAAQYLIVPDGIRILNSYRPEFAVVQIAVAARDGWVSSSWSMTWHDNDWRVQVPADIDTLWQPALPVATITDFGQWKGIS